jgi:hypothetical protein
MGEADESCEASSGSLPSSQWVPQVGSVRSSPVSSWGVLGGLAVVTVLPSYLTYWVLTSGAWTNEESPSVPRILEPISTKVSSNCIHIEYIMACSAPSLIPGTPITVLGGFDQS